MTDAPLLHWTEDGQPRALRWRSESGLAPPRRVQVADDTLAADTAYRLACEGTALLWRGDYQNARQLLAALARRIDRPARKPKRKATTAALPV
ncbi:MAG: methyltransferase, partial [Burkholderiaceae bacterium]